MDLRAQINEIVRRLAVVEQRLDAIRPGVANTIVLDKELDRVLEKIHLIKSTYSGMQTWSEDDVQRLSELIIRRDEIKALLGVKE